jgi:hypothetical protein
MSQLGRLNAMSVTTPLQKLSLAARAHLSELLDEALEETFPASDPIAIAVELETMEDRSSERHGHRKDQVTRA